VIAQKIVSKAEGRQVDLRTVTASERARQLAAEVDKDPRLVEWILSESTEVVRHRKGVLVVAHRSGTVLANAGIDASNVGPDGDDQVLLLPEDCDRSCRDIRAKLRAYTGIDAGVIIIDSLGRAWRNGTVGVALGAAGLPTLLDLRGQPDLFGRTLRTTQVGIADEIAAAASLLMGQADEGTPVALVRGLQLPEADGSANDLIRARALDLFR
jgi:coenzyme F420-0:L-glutamate ligase/coenzyme F420-1:gamma-L-glutamate ligase